MDATIDRTDWIQSTFVPKCGSLNQNHLLSLMKLRPFFDKTLELFMPVSGSVAYSQRKTLSLYLLCLLLGETCSTHGKIRNEYKILVSKHEATLERPKRGRGIYHTGS
jgi:hypothetical protein